MAIQSKDFSVTGKSASGSITYTYILRVTENSAGIVNGKPVSNVTVNAILKQSYSGLTFSQWTTTVTGSINGVQRFNDSAQRRLEGTSEHNYYTWTGDIEHNADGQLAITVGGSLSVVDPGQSKPQPLTIVEDSNNVMVLTPVMVTTACTAPTSVSISPSVFEDRIDISWSGASGGENNPITGYNIYFSSNGDSSNWNDNGSDWKVVWTRESSCSITLDRLTSDGIDVSRGKYLKFAIQTLGSAGTEYDSEWKAIGVVQRNPYTACTAPTSFTVSPSIIDPGQSVTLSWSGAAGGSNNAITGYEIEQAVSVDDVNWNGWSSWQTVTGNSCVDASQIARGYYGKYRIRTLGSAGSSYYSEWKESNSFQINPYVVEEYNYDITYHGSGGFYDDALVIDVHNDYIWNTTSTEYRVISDPLPTRNGYTLVGWSLNEDGSGTIYKAGDIVPEFAGISGQDREGSLYAVWEEVKKYNYDIFYHGSGGFFDGYIIDVHNDYISNTTSAEYRVISDPLPIRDGYTFVGWSLNPDGSGTIYRAGDIVPELSGISGQDREGSLYAVWEEEGYSYDIYYEYYSACYEDKITNTSDKDYRVSEFTPSYIPEGYTFVGWSLNPDDSSTIYRAGDIVPEFAGIKGQVVNGELWAIFEEESDNNNTSPIRVNVGGVLHKGEIPRVKVEGSWKKGIACYVKVGNIWKKNIK